MCDGAGLSSRGVGAFLNGNTAAFSGGWIRFPCGFTIFIQEKGNTVASQSGSAAVLAEYNAVRDACGAWLSDTNHVLLFMVDGTAVRVDYPALS